ncbi:MAG TPA: Tat pathway signal sequence, partial [Chloroflexota bacterium]|nr:Tat pathway signal sequence [Chloroflexota bacterium]
LHSHCGISYCHGTLARALAVARQQLDFCAVTGHAFWPDLPDEPDDPARLGPIRAYHEAGFARLREGWDGIQRQVAAANEPGRFTTFLSYEWHSNADGDHHVLYCGDHGPLLGGDRIWDLKAALNGATLRGDATAALAIPHHVGYPAGYRGVNWDTFTKELSPFVEIYSMHGCAESDEAPYPYLRRMGPRDGRSTASWGLRQGHRVGLVGSTDHHAAYPGSHGYGRLAAAAGALTREALWDAFLARRVYAATGDRIALDFRLNGAWMGEEIDATGPREIQLKVGARDEIAFVELLKNEHVLRHWPGPLPVAAAPVTAAQREGSLRALVRIEWGWGSTPDVAWQFRFSVSDGCLLGVEPCFSGPPVSAPVEHFVEYEALSHEVLEQSGTACVWLSRTDPSPTERHSANQALLVEVELPPDAPLTLEVNGQRFVHTLAELLEASRAHVLRGWRSEAVLLHRAIPTAVCRLEETLVDGPSQSGVPTLHHSEREQFGGKQMVDCYRVRVAQRNGQWAWSSPIWARG